MSEKNSNEVYLQEVIISRQLRRGKGIEGDPIRVITQVLDKEGNLIAENDPYFELEEYEVLMKIPHSLTVKVRDLINPIS